MLVCVPRTHIKDRPKPHFLSRATRGGPPTLFFIHYELFIFAQRSSAKKKGKGIPFPCKVYKKSRAAVCSQSKPTVIWQVGALHPQSRSLLPLAVYTRGGRSAIRRGTNPGSQRLI